MIDVAADFAEFLQDIVAEAFTDENNLRQADRDPLALTMSGLGGCTRRNAYAVARVDPSDEPPQEEARQALLGAGAHDWFLPALARVLTRRIGVVCAVEKRVALRAAGIEISGHLDLAYPGVIVDLKTVREHRLHGVRRRAERGAYDEHQVQVTGYGVAEYQAGGDVQWIVYLYMDRTTGEVYPVIDRFTNSSAMAVLDRVETIVRFAKEDPDAAPREARGPGLSMECDRCPWLRRCWGPTATPGETGPQTQLAATPDGLIEILKLAHTASQLGTQAKKDRDFAKLVLTRTRSGSYGEYNLKHGDDTDEVDSAAMVKILSDLGIAVPRKRRVGATYVKLVR